MILPLNVLTTRIPKRTKNIYIKWYWIQNKITENGNWDSIENVVYVRKMNQKNWFKIELIDHSV